mmetsp:Transcript_15376/g.11183  ORF Transcript_15376/g.11183 Transcript_15376/m.11183 type:complete len:93 (+) Transcript_15376:219-497(+)|eukprot:CAMPEP_0202966762 /NCGR_PEP_ID=MMETSP1396-20130829/11316_1 /ASSEMBLY_ACC=CAM_ASM_000872 /TAXON_ID= /ORGANISM="Pseudokeronopsis sp., Strain Brazil" /LENGTH=92 /DNA_ID=CAMNT_0049690995 /DNA_START=123 /DNA_END=401 /DNA_ORIENTATION=+
MKLRLGYQHYFEKQQNFEEEHPKPAASLHKNTIINENWDDRNTLFSQSKIAYLNQSFPKDSMVQFENSEQDMSVEKQAPGKIRMYNDDYDED